MDVFDEELARLGEEIMRRRQEYLGVICPEIYRTYHDISGGRETLSVQYRPTCEPGALLETLRQSRRRDPVGRRVFARWGRTARILSFLWTSVRLKFTQAKASSAALCCR